MISEPVAAAIGAKYHLRNQDLSAIILDIGHTTLKISVVYIDAEGTIEVEGDKILM